MSRGGKCILAGIVCVVASYLVGMAIEQAAVDGFNNARGANDAFKTVQELSPWATLANLVFYLGLLLAAVGVVMLIVDGSRQLPPGHSGSSATEDENRRLREELKHLRSDRPDGSSGTPS